MARDEILRLLLQHKLEFLHTGVDACMLWWVSSVLFIGSIFSTVVIGTSKILNIPDYTFFLGIPVFDWLFGGLFVFFSTIVGWGRFAVYPIRGFEQGVANIVGQLKISARPTSEFVATEVAIPIGITAFFIGATVCWYFLLKMMRKDKKEWDKKKKKNHNLSSPTRLT
ncbi:MAG: hypothetical protein GTN76_16960 [Candidatus Aenigmarchaeota archaeon]|nr:hypothetical protein [Candidatus Aenigmarchaeota archaeon]